MPSILPGNKSIAFLILLAYFLALVYFHEGATEVADWLKYKLTLRYYNLSLLISGLLLSFVFACFLFRKILKYRERRMFFYWFLISIILMVLAVFTLMVVNMEAIHFIQYGILAVLVFQLVRRYEDAFILAVILGFIDEIYQYLILNPTFKYFDFNDIVLNMIGAGAGLLIMAVMKFPAILAPRRWYFSLSIWFIASIFVLGIFFSLSPAISFFPITGNPPDSHLFFIYRDILPDQFWTHLYGNRYYHILRPWEGIIALSVLTIFYSMLDSFYFKAIKIKSLSR